MPNMPPKPPSRQAVKATTFTNWIFHPPKGIQPVVISEAGGVVAVRFHVQEGAELDFMTSLQEKMIEWSMEYADSLRKASLVKEAAEKMESRLRGGHHVDADATGDHPVVPATIPPNGPVGPHA